MDQETTVLIKEEEIVENPEDSLNIRQPSLHVKQERELMHYADGSELNECTLAAMYPETVMFIKKEETVELPDEPDSMVATPTGSESESRRLMEHSSESCYISSEEAVKQEVVPSELEIGAGESMSSTMFVIQTQQTKEEDEGLFGIRLKCRLREKEFQILNCSFCQQSFPSKYKLIMHVFIHIDGVEPPKYICKSCGKVFCSNISLNRHVKISAGVKALFDGHRCVICGKYFTRLSNLKRHSLIHTGIRPHKCDICGKSFSQLFDLKKHSLIHTGTKPHECVTCGKSFTQLSNLKQHSLIHTGLKPHKCLICGKSFTHPSTLKGHTLIHTR